MRILLALILTLGLATGGCAWFSSSDDSETQTPAAQRFSDFVKAGLAGR